MFQDICSYCFICFIYCVWIIIIFVIISYCYYNIFTVCNKKGHYLGHASFIWISRLPNDGRIIWLKHAAVNIRRLILTGCVIRFLYLLADCSLYLVCGNYDFLFEGIGCQGRITNGFILRSCVNCTRNWRKAFQFSHHQHLWQEGGIHFFVIDKA